MALQPRTPQSQEMLQPGARGDMFVNNGIPGHRHDGQRINRSNNTLNLNDHDVLNFKYGLDPRLPSLYRYGWGYGYNQITIPKGRIVGVDPYMMVLDTDDQHFYSVATLANGGKNVRLAEPADFAKGGALEKLAKNAETLIGRIWVECEDAIDEGDDFLTTSGGYVGLAGKAVKNVRPANVPVGILERNEYTRNADAFNGISLGPIRTDCLVELPWFKEAEKAVLNPWGSVVGNLKPGDLVCADENGRFVASPLNPRHPDYAATIADVGAYEKARRQIIGEVYSVDPSLLPVGAARFAQWALEDRRKFHDFNPFEWPMSNRDGEDFVENPPTVYQSDFRYPGYPVEKGTFANDLHMLASSREGLVDPRFDEEHRLDRGIPALTDGYNAVEKAYGSSERERDIALDGEPLFKVSHMGIVDDQKLLDNPDCPVTLVRLKETNVEKAKIKIGDREACLIPVGRLNAEAGDTPIEIDENFEVVYVDLHKGLIQVRQKKAADKAVKKAPIFISYVKRGMAGVPTNLDWDGCAGTVRILMTK